MLLWIFLSLMLNAYSLDVVLNPFKHVDYDDIAVYDFTEDKDDCECNCAEY